MTDVGSPVAAYAASVQPSAFSLAAGRRVTTVACTEHAFAMRFADGGVLRVVARGRARLYALTDCLLERLLGRTVVEARDTLAAKAGLACVLVVTDIGPTVEIIAAPADASPAWFAEFMEAP